MTGSIVPSKDVGEESTSKSFLILIGLFSCALFVFVCIYVNFPQLEEHERVHIKLPLNLEEAKNLGKVLDRYKEKFYVEVLSTFLFTYIFLQTFAIPGSISLSILSGFLYPYPLALALVCFCSATGASLCYLLSFNVARKLIYKYFPNQISSYASKVKAHQDNLLYYMIFLRVTPFFPNWLINIAAPVVEVPFLHFWLGTFIGVGPPSFIAIQTGKTLHEITSEKGTWSWNSIILLAVFAVLSLLPVYFKEKLADKEQTKEE
ncbi:transmembrane protein 41B [Planococcus citri]|uniref:transmembrane protein 41B n=1 Tax=Planococcus citri TaxID=170843 RepID=UPI0031F73A62